MSIIHIVRPHNLPHDEIRADVEALASDLQKKLHARYHWEGETLRFSRTGASGSIRVEVDRITIDVKLGLVLAPLKGQLERMVHDYLDERLA